MSTALAAAGPDMLAIEQTLVGGDLSKLTPAQRVSYYNQVCGSLDLNPLTKPFAYITLNGKLTLYALKDCTEQLRNKRAISVQIMAREVVEDCFVVTARASMANGRQDESIGAVPIANLKGEARANAFMKAETKAKRRVTLSICGLGILDETEVDGIDGPRGYVVEAPVTAPLAPVVASVGIPSVQNGGDSGHHSDEGPAVLDELPPGTVTIRRVDITPTRNKNVQKALLMVSTGETYATINPQLTALAEQLAQEGCPVLIEAKENRFGMELVSLHRAEYEAPEVPVVTTTPLTDSEIPF